MHTGGSPSKLTTALRYRDVGQAADWLCTAFGFELRTSAVRPDRDIAFVQLTYGSHLFMLLPVGGSELDGLMRQPDEIGGAETQSCYLVVDDAEAHLARAQTGGAEIISPLKAFEGGGLGYICRDLEGHIWHFGTYDPWGTVTAEAMPLGRVTRAAYVGQRLPPAVFLAAVAGVVALAGVSGAGMHRLTYSSPQEIQLRADVMAAKANIQAALDQAMATKERADQASDLASRHASDLAQERGAKEALGRDLQRGQEQLARERSAREGVERTLKQREAEHAEERRARAAAERATGLAGEAATRERAQKEAAERATAEVRKELTLTKTAKARAERTLSETSEKLAAERAAKEAAERSVKELQEKLKQAAAAVAAAAAAPPAPKPAIKPPPAPQPAKKSATSSTASPPGPAPAPSLAP